VEIIPRGVRAALGHRIPKLGHRQTLSEPGVVESALDEEMVARVLAQRLYEREARGEARGEATGMEKMIIAAFRSNAAPEVIETMQKDAGVTDAQIAKLRKQALAH